MSEIVFDAEKHTYRRDGVFLDSVTRVIKAVWPVKPDYSAADPVVLENARLRGIETETLFYAYLRGEMTEYPEGTREDACELCDKLINWWESRPECFHGDVETQVIVGDAEIAGTLDLLIGGFVWDLKCTSGIEPTYLIQVAAYSELGGFGIGGIIQINKGLKAPKFISPTTVQQKSDLDDWLAIRKVWSAAKRRAPKGIENA